MPNLSQLFKRELEVAFGKKSQSFLFRIVKYFLIAVLCYFLWNTGYLWQVLFVLFILSLALHFWFRYKTHGWTQSYGPWKYDKD